MDPAPGQLHRSLGFHMGDPIQPPSDPFAPFEPSSQQPWNERWVGHLMRRAGFGVTSCEVASREAKKPHFQVVLAIADKPKPLPLKNKSVGS